MKRYVTGIALALATVAPGKACDIEQVASDIYFNAITRAGELSKQELGLLERFRAIGNRAKDPNKPLNQQLSQQDLAEFAQVQQRHQAIEVQQLLESNYARDARVIRDFYQVAQADYLGAPTPKEGDKNYLPYAFLAVMMVASEDKTIQDKLVTEPATKSCNLENALHEIELESLGRLGRLPLAQASRELEAMQGRMGGGKIDRDKLNASDRAIFDRLQRTAYVPAQREKLFITNLESLKLLARTSAMKFELGKKDATDSGGDIDSVGQSVAALNLDARAKMGFGMLEKIAEKYPSDWFKQRQAIAPQIETIKKENAARTSKK
ncbi:hypothetical protein ABIB90_002735 [Bradyrhizobium sp. JR4.1]|uniref:hypothetical protein n=1 Tax=Bradyrhizobium sp. JR4.1 TaxID=3156372 RepID=UPI0033927578